MYLYRVGLLFCWHSSTRLDHLSGAQKSSWIGILSYFPFITDGIKKKNLAVFSAANDTTKAWRTTWRKLWMICTGSFKCTIFNECFLICATNQYILHVGAVMCRDIAAPARTAGKWPANLTKATCAVPTRKWTRLCTHHSNHKPKKKKNNNKALNKQMSMWDHFTFVCASILNFLIDCYRAYKGT